MIDRASSEHPNINKVSISDNEVGAAYLEAGIVMTIIIPVIFFAMYFFIVSYKMTTTHYLMQDSLRKTLSVRPSASFDQNFETAKADYTSGTELAKSLLKNFDAFGYNFDKKDFILRNGSSCYELKGDSSSASFYPTDKRSGCAKVGSIAKVTPITEYSFVSMEMDVRLFSQNTTDSTTQEPKPFKFFGIEIASPKAVVGTRIDGF